MNATLTRIAMVLPIVAALLALTAGWASAQPGPDFPGDIATQPIVDPQPPKPPKWDLPIVDVDDVTVDPAPPADPPADPAPSDDSDSDDDSDHGDHNSNDDKSTGGTVRPAAGKSVPVVAETDSAFQGNDTTSASESISPKYLQSTGAQQIPTGVVFGVGALLMAVIGWAAYRHHRLSLTI